MYDFIVKFMAKWYDALFISLANDFHCVVSKVD